MELNTDIKHFEFTVKTWFPTSDKKSLVITIPYYIVQNLELKNKTKLKMRLIKVIKNG